MYEQIISTQHAQDIALQKVPGNIQQVDMNLVYGIVIYKIYILTDDNKRHRVDIDAKTGKVLKVKTKT